jgi:hypothetical protein
MTTTTTDRRAEWRRLLDIQEARRQKYDVLLSSRRPPPVVGDLLSFADRIQALGVLWVALTHHDADPDIWILVPADTVMMAGSSDLIVQSGFGPLAVRCGLAVSCHRDDIAPECRVGALDGWDIERAREKLEQVFEGQLDAGLEAQENDADLHLEAWLSEIGDVRDRLASLLYAQTPEEAYIDSLVERCERALLSEGSTAPNWIPVDESPASIEAVQDQASLRAALLDALSKPDFEQSRYAWYSVDSAEDHRWTDVYRDEREPHRTVAIRSFALRLDEVELHLQLKVAVDCVVWTLSATAEGQVLEGVRLTVTIEGEPRTAETRRDARARLSTPIPPVGAPTEVTITWNTGSWSTTIT